METETAPITMWAVVELMGHRRLAGRVSEQQIAGAVLLRLDIPLTPDTTLTQFYSPSAIYCLTPCDEATARSVAAHHQPAPIARWELLPPGPPPRAGYAESDDIDAF